MGWGHACEALPAFFHEYWAISGNFQRRGGLMIYIHFWKNPWILYICYFPLRKQAFTLGNSTNFYYSPWKLQDQKSKTNGKSTLLFLDHPWKIHFFFNWFWDFCLLFSIPFEFPYPQLRLYFFWNRVVIKNVFG